MLNPRRAAAVTRPAVTRPAVTRAAPTRAAPTRAARVTRAVAVLSLPVVALLGAGACDAQVSNTVVDGLTRATPVTAVRIGNSGSGDLTVVADPTVTGVDLRRTVHFVQSRPAETARFDGDALVLDLDCGFGCGVSYQVRVPTAVTVSGQATSGDLVLQGVGAVDVSLSSGDIRVERATGPVKVHSTSGDVTITDTSSPVTVSATSGDIRATGLTGSPNQFDVTSGTTDVTLAAPVDVTVEATSGDVDLTVPGGPYQVDARSNSGAVVVQVATDPGAGHRLQLRTTSGNVTVSPDEG